MVFASLVCVVHFCLVLFVCFVGVFVCFVVVCLLFGVVVVLVWVFVLFRAFLSSLLHLLNCLYLKPQFFSLLVF